MNLHGELDSGILQSLKRGQILSTFESYIRYVRGSAFKFGWFHSELCTVLDKWVSGDWPRLQIYMPVRHGKSELVGRLLPGYIVAKFANPRAPIGIIYGTHTQPLARMINRNAQAYMTSDEYRWLTPNRRLPGADIESRDEKFICNQDEWEFLVRHGSRWVRGATFACRGVGGGIGGYDGTFVVVDDLLRGRDDAESEAERDNGWDWFRGVISQRLQPIIETDGSKTPGRLLITTTRWHTDDVAGRLLDQIKETKNAEGWRIVVLPAIMDSEARTDEIRRYMPDGFEDNRQDGEALWPWKYSTEELLRIKQVSSPYEWDSVYQQRPQSAESRKINISWFKVMSAMDFGEKAKMAV